MGGGGSIPTGGATAEFTFRVVSRDVVRQIEVMGQGREARVFTTDLWLWEGVDARAMPTRARIPGSAGGPARKLNPAWAQSGAP